MFEDIYKNFGDLEATHQSVQAGAALPMTEDTYNYTRDELYALGSAKQKAIDEHNRLLEEKDASFLSAVTNFWQHDTMTGVGINKFIQGPQETDPDFDVNKAITQVQSEFNENNIEVLKGAKNQEHFELLADNLRDYNDHLLNLERLGVPASIAAQLVAELGNVVNYVPFLNVAKAGKLMKTKDILKASAMQGALNASEEKLIDLAYKDREVSDYVAAFAMGAAVTGGVLGTSKAWNTTKFEASKRIKDEADAFALNRMKDRADEKKAEAEAGPRPERDWTNSSHLRDQDGKLDERIASRMEEKGYDPDNEFDVWVENYEANGLLPKVKKVVQEKLKLAGFAQTLAGSDNPYIRALNRALFEHGEGGLGVHKELTAALEADLETKRLFSGYAQAMIQSKAAFGVEAKKLGIDMKEFDRIAYRYIDSDGAIGIDGKIRVPGTTSKIYDILDEFKKVYEEHTRVLTDHVRRAGVSEFKEIEPGEIGHLFRKYDTEQFYKLTQELGSSEPLVDLISESIRRGGGFEEYSNKVLAEVEAKYQAELKDFETRLRRAENQKATAEADIRRAKDFTKEMQAGARLDKAIRRIEEIEKTRPKQPEVKIDQDKIIRNMARAVYNRMYNRSTANAADANLLSTHNQTLLLEALDDLGLDKADYDHVKAVLDTAGKDLKQNPIAKRIKMDMNTSIGVGDRQIRITDLLDVDLGSGYMSTGRYWLGRAALARKGDHLASPEDIEKSLERARQMGIKYGMDAKDVKHQVDLIRKGIDLITGRPIEDMSKTSYTLMRNIRKAIVNSFLGKLGIIQASETGRMIAAVDSTMRLPVIRDLVKGIVTGRVDSAQLKEIEDYLVGDIGFRPYMNHPDFRADDFGHKIHPAEKLQDTMGYYLAKASGWNRVYTMQNKTLMNGLSQKWYRQVMDGTFPEAQMRDLGVDDLLLKDLKEQMQKHAKKVEGLTGEKTYTELGLENWDPAVRRKFALMLHRKASNAIQVIQTGETPMWLNTAMGQFLGQFRTFSIAALSKQTTRDYKMLREGDREAALAMYYNLCTSVMANAVKIGFAAGTMAPDRREEYLEKALRPASLVNQVMSYTGPLSPLMDASNILGDTFMGDTWNEVAGGRYGFRGKGLTAAVPGLDFINKAYKGVSGMSTATFTDRELSPADWRSLYSIMPFSNQYVFDALNNGLITPNLFEE
jgi:hypothetical protein